MVCLEHPWTWWTILSYKRNTRSLQEAQQKNMYIIIVIYIIIIIRNKVYQHMLITTLKTQIHHTVQTQTPQTKKNTFHEQTKKQPTSESTISEKSKSWNFKNHPTLKGKIWISNLVFHRGLEVAFKMVPTDSSEFWRWLCHPVFVKAGFCGEVEKYLEDIYIYIYPSYL